MAYLTTKHAQLIHAITKAKVVELDPYYSPADLEAFGKMVADTEHAFREFYTALVREAECHGLDVSIKDADNLMSDLFGDVNMKGAIEARKEELSLQAAAE